ncbi:hypothetical protein N180_16645 [Pedobacter antarcticus 4BY]|uniref:Uncharacterized protein n=1 Tax=Pedobacter antarcticus 4BY TaxID=1358423 RepID=A0A081PHD0_9SPHI|nr:hypothetical protein N180_16645 [Pedobacter antarcticus 4BY]
MLHLGRWAANVVSFFEIQNQFSIKLSKKGVSISIPLIFSIHFFQPEAKNLNNTIKMAVNTTFVLTGQ